MYYLTSGMGKISVDDSVVILSGNGELADFLDNGFVGLGAQEGTALTLVGNDRQLMLCGNRGNGQSFVSVYASPSVTGFSGYDDAVYFSGSGAKLNFAAQGGAVRPASSGTYRDDRIRINAQLGWENSSLDRNEVEIKQYTIQDAGGNDINLSYWVPAAYWFYGKEAKAYRTSWASNPTPQAITAVVSAVRAKESLSIESDLSGVLNTDVRAIHDGYQGTEDYVDVCSGSSPVANGILVGKDLTLRAGFSGSVTTNVAAANISYKGFNASGNSVNSTAFQVKSGEMTVIDSFEGTVVDTATILVHVDSRFYEQKKDEMPGGSGDVSNNKAYVQGIEAQSLDIQRHFAGSISSTLEYGIDIAVIKDGDKDSKLAYRPPRGDVSVAANSGVIGVFAVNAKNIVVGGDVTGVFTAEAINSTVRVYAEGKTTSTSMNSWSANVAGFSGNTMTVGGNLGGSITARGSLAFTAITIGKQVEAADKITNVTTVQDNKSNVIGLDIANKLKVDGSISSNIKANGSFTIDASTSGGNIRNTLFVQNNDLIVAGIRTQSLEVSKAISGNITVDGSMGIRQERPGANFTISNPVNRFGVYGIKTNDLKCAELSGTITVNSQDLNTASFNQLTIQTVGIYVENAINGGSADVPLTISGRIDVNAECGIAAAIMRGSGDADGGVYVRVTGDINVSSRNNAGNNYNYAVYVGTAWTTVVNNWGGGTETDYITTPIDDRIEIAGKATVVGSFELSTGTNYVTIDSSAMVTGDLITTGGTLNLTLNLVGTNKAADAILITNTDFASTACSISTFTLELNEAKAGTTYKLLEDTTGRIDSKWVGRSISLHYNGQTIIARVGNAALNEYYTSTVNGLEVNVYMTSDGKNIVAQVGDNTKALQVAPGIAVDAEGNVIKPVINANQATFSWQDMSQEYDGTGDNANAGYVLTSGEQVNRYEVEISLRGDFSKSISRYVMGDNVGVAPTSLTVDGFAQGTYYWRVRTIYSDGSQSDWSRPADNTFTVTDQVFYTQPAAISVDSMTAKDPNTPTNHYNNSTVLLDWADSSAATGINYYVVEYIESINQNDFYIAAQGKDVLGEDGKVTAQGWDSWLAANPGIVQSRIVTASELLLTGLANYSNLHFRIKAVANDLGLYPNGEIPKLEGEWAYYDKPVVVWVGDQAAPTNPSDLLLVVTNPQYPSDTDPEAQRTADASVSWNKALDHQSGVQKYVVEYLVAKDGGEIDWSSASIAELSGNKDNIVPALRFDLPGLVENAADQSYYWRVKAVDYAGNVGEWAYGDSFKIDLTDPTDPVPGKVTVAGMTEEGASGVTFSWTASEDASPLAYSLWISTQADFSDVKSINLNVKGTLAGSTVSYTLTADEFTALKNGGYTFADGTTYYWRVQAFDSPVGADYHNSSKVVDSSFVVDLVDNTPPDVPQNFFVGQVPGEKIIQVSWDEAHDNKPAGILRYELKYRTDSSQAWSELPTITVSGKLDYRMANAIEGAEYEWVIRAVDMAGNIGEWSDIAKVVCDITPPSTPAGKLNVSVTATKNGGPSVDFSWATSVDNVDGTNVGYVLQVSKDYRFPSATLESISITARFDDAANTTRFYLGKVEIGSLVDGNVMLHFSGDNLGRFEDFSRYYFRVQAVDSVGNKSAFAGSTANYFEAPDKTAPTVPGDLRMQRTSGVQKVTLSWSAAKDNDASHVLGYQVSYWTKDDKSDLVTIDNIAGTKTDVALPAGQVFWQVVAKDFAGNVSAPSSVYEGVVDYEAPNQPENLLYTIVDRAVTLTWEAPTPLDPAPSSGFAYYEVRYSTDPNYMSTVTVQTPVSGTDTRYFLAANFLPDNVLYYWSVRAVDKVGNVSAWKDGMSFVTPDTTNIPDDASPLALGTPVTERVGGSSDPADYYFVTLAKTGSYNFALKDANPNISLKLQLVGADGKVTNITYRAGQDIDLLAGNYRLGVTYSGASTVYTLDSEMKEAYDIHNGDDDMKTTDRAVALTLSDDGTAASGTYSDWVGFGDVTDSYKLVVTNAGSYAFEISGLAANVTVTLYNEKFTTQSGWSMTAKAGATNILSGKLLMPGTYYVKVDRTGSTNTGYTVSVGGEVFPVDNSDDTAALVDQLLAEHPADKHLLDVSERGVVSEFSDWVGYGDKEDFYKFSLDQKGTYSLTLSDLSNRATVTLWAKDANGKLVSKNSFSFAPSGSLNSITGSLVNLESGDYYIQISAPDSSVGKNTGYTVTVNGESFKPGEDDNTFNTAWVKNNALSTGAAFESEFSDWVGFGDTEDFRLLGSAQGPVSFTATLDIANAATLYVYQVAANGTVLKQLVTLTPKLTFNADGSLKSISGNRLAVNSGSAVDGTEYSYYYKVVSTGAASGKNTDYTLETIGGKNAINNADDKLAEATALTGDGFGKFSTVTDGGIGYGDTTDYFKFVLDQEGQYGFKISSLDGDNYNGIVTLQLLSATGARLKTISVDLSNGQTIGSLSSEVMKAGTYFLYVSGSATAGFSGYDLTIDGMYRPNSVNNSRAEAAELVFSQEASPMRAAVVDPTQVVRLNSSASGWVGKGDTVDFYSFSVDSEGRYDFSLRGIDGAAKLTIYTKSFNALGQEIASVAVGSVTANGAGGKLSVLLTGGDYYVEVSSNGKTVTDTNYYLDAKAETFASLTVDGTTELTFDGAGEKTYRFDWIGGNLALSVGGDADNLSYALYHQVGNRLVEITSSDAAGALNQTGLAAGTYFVKARHEGTAAANFDLSFEVDEVAPCYAGCALDFDADQELAAAPNLLPSQDGRELAQTGIAPDCGAASDALRTDEDLADALKRGILA